MTDIQTITQRLDAAPTDNQQAIQKELIAKYSQAWQRFRSLATVHSLQYKGGYNFRFAYGDSWFIERAVGRVSLDRVCSPEGKKLTDLAKDERNEGWTAGPGYYLFTNTAVVFPEGVLMILAGGGHISADTGTWLVTSTREKFFPGWKFIPTTEARDHSTTGV